MTVILLSLYFSLSLVFMSVSAVESSLDSRSQGALNSSVPGGSFVSTAWYAGWHAAEFPLSAISWSKYTEIKYAFALTSPDPNVLSLAESDKILLSQFVTASHKHKVKASLSIGGWTGSRWFSTNVGSAQNRTALVRSVVALVRKFDLDGVDFDWEYPGRQGIGCNAVNPDDTANFLSFLQELRRSVRSNTTLSAATDISTFVDSSGNPSTDVSGFSKVVDYIAIMNYDTKSYPSTGVGPNAPLDDTCAPSSNRFGSAVSSVAAWSNAGMPLNQIVLGVPAYGHSYRVPSSAAFGGGSGTTLASYPAFATGNKPSGDRWDGEGGLDVCGVYEGPGGLFTFGGLLEGGFLNSDGSAKDGVVYRFDECSKTPFIYNPRTEVMVSYDNPQSFAAKGNYIKSMGLRGFAMWEAAGDSNDVLLDSILNATVNSVPTKPKEVPQPSSLSKASSSASSLHTQSFWDFFPKDWTAILIIWTLISTSIPP